MEKITTVRTEAKDIYTSVRGDGCGGPVHRPVSGVKDGARAQQPPHHPGHDGCVLAAAAHPAGRLHAGHLHGEYSTVQLIEMVRDCLAKSQDRLKILLRELQLGEVSAARQVFKYFFSIKIFFYSKVFLDPSQVCRDCVAQGVLPAAEGPGGGLAYNIFRSKYLLAGASGEQLEDGGCQQRAVLQVKLGGGV